MKLLQYCVLALAVFGTKNQVYSQFHLLSDEHSQSLHEVMLHKYYTDAEISIIQTDHPEKNDRLKFLCTQSFEVADSAYTLEQILSIDVNRMDSIRKRDEVIDYLDPVSGVLLRLMPLSVLETSSTTSKLQ